MTKEKKTSQVPALLKELQEGVRGVFESERYKEWLTAMARFHRYSVNNQMLIFMQHPEATRVASVKTWNEMGRHVRKGEHGIKVLVPTPVKVKDSEDDSDEEKKVMRFKVGHVFDISQTEGEPLPEIGARELEGNFEDFEDIFRVVRDMSSVPILRALV